MSFLDVIDIDKPRWYVVHTYSGYENKVKTDLEKTVENRGLQSIIYDIMVPEEEVIEVKDGKKKMVKHKIFPGYVLIKMKMSDDSWYIVRNTRGVTGFVGPGSKPVPLTDSEIKSLGIRETTTAVEFSVGDSVRVTDGPLANFIGKVEEIEMEKQKIKVSVSMFGRETPVELDFVQVQKI